VFGLLLGSIWAVTRGTGSTTEATTGTAPETETGSEPMTSSDAEN
jgi:hypothetical protein